MEGNKEGFCAFGSDLTLSRDVASIPTMSVGVKLRLSKLVIVIVGYYL